MNIGLFRKRFNNLSSSYFLVRYVSMAPQFADMAQFKDRK